MMREKPVQPVEYEAVIHLIALSDRFLDPLVQQVAPDMRKPSKDLEMLFWPSRERR